MLKSEIIAAVATPPGEGGIAVIRASGQGVRRIAARIFRPASGRDMMRGSGYSVHYGEILDEKTSEVADDGLLTLFVAPRSYTGEDAMEISCHGGRATTARVLEIVLNAGARLAEPGEFTLRAFMNGRIDLAQAEAVADLIRAKTESAQKLARRQLEGSLSVAVQKLRGELIGILAAIEVTIDFSEEVGDLDYALLLVRISNVREETERLLGTADQGRILREGLRVALVGKPNVGKSSLFNALLGSNRSIVTHAPGTTRDLLEETANIEGVPLILIDLAGIREADDLAERLGVERAVAAAERSDLILFLTDAQQGVAPEDEEVIRLLSRLSETRTIAVVNKIDSASDDRVSEIIGEVRKRFEARKFCAVSAKTGVGLHELKRAMLEVAAGERFGAEGASDSVVVANVRHKQALTEANNSLLEAEKTAQMELPGDFIVIDVRGALDALGSVTGENVSDEIIHRIFHDFCVGK